MKRGIAVLLVLGLLAAAGYYYFWPRRFRQQTPQDDTLLLSGNIEAHESVLSFKISGRIVELAVEEGQWVEPSTVLARLEDRDLRQQVALDEAALRVREAGLTLALAGSRRQEIAAAQQALLDAEADLKQRRLDHERAQTLYRKDVISEQERDWAATNLAHAEANVARARERLDQLREGARVEEIAIARTQVQQAREALQLSRLRLDYTVLRAPQAGVVMVRQAELGEVVAAGTPVVTLADLDNVWLRAYVSETDLGRIRWGQPARVRTDTLPGKEYHGRISFIASKAEFTPKSVQTQRERVTLVYRIKIDLANPNHELKPGMPADAVIQPLAEAK